jgi:hypothetical protein
VVPFDGGYRAWREAVAGGWTVEAARAREAARLRPVAAPERRRAGVAGRGAAFDVGGSATNGHGDLEGGAELVGSVAASAAASAPASARASRAARLRGPKLSKDAYRRQREAADAELTRLGLRRNHLELSMSDPAVQSNFVELRRVTSELADVDTALAAAEETWLAVEERAP